MIHFNYTGQLSISPDIRIEQASSKSGDFGKDEILFEKLRLSNKNLIKYKSKQYLLLVDGIIYEFDHKLFSEEIYSAILDQCLNNEADTLRKLRGEFVLMIVNLATSECFIATSESGNAALFYKEIGDSLYFSNSVKGLLSIGKSSNKINFQRIYDILSANSLGAESTCFTDIKRLLPGHYLKLGKGSSVLGNYSILYEGIRESVKDSEAYSRFRDIFSKAVNLRINADRIGIALSSGKDSTSVTAMTSKLLSTVDQKLYSYSFKPTFLNEEQLGDPRFDETILLKSFFKFYPSIISREVIVGSGSILGSLENAINIYGEPVFGAANQFWIQKMQRMMVEDRCEVMLTGQGGNYTISWPPPELIKSRRGYVKDIISRLRPKQLKDSPMMLPYISKPFLQSIDTNHFLNSYEGFNHDQLQTVLLKNSVSYTGNLQKQASLYYGFHISDPTLDKDLINFCLSIPFNTYHRGKNTRKLVVRGLGDILPDEIRNNRIRSIQGADIRVRFHQERDQILEKLILINKNKLVTFVLETGSLVKNWKHIDFLSMSKKELNHLLRIIQMGLFLSEMEDK